MRSSSTSLLRYSAVPRTRLTLSKMLICSPTCATSTLTKGTSLQKVTRGHLSALQVTTRGKSYHHFRIKVTLMTKRRRLIRITQKETQNSSSNRAQVHSPHNLQSEIKASRRMTGIYATVCCLFSWSGTTQNSWSSSKRDKFLKVRAVRRRMDWPDRRGRSTKSTVAIPRSCSTLAVPRTLSMCQSTMARRASQ